MNSLKLKSFIFFTHPDLSGDESSLSTRREARLNDKVGQGEEGESINRKINTPPTPRLQRGVSVQSIVSTNHENDFRTRLRHPPIRKSGNLSACR